MRPYERNVMNVIKQKLNSAKNIVQQHQTKILGTAVVLTTTVAVLQKRGLNQHNDFLKEKGLHDEFNSTSE
jgi:hypothetical protein